MAGATDVLKGYMTITPKLSSDADAKMLASLKKVDTSSAGASIGSSLAGFAMKAFAAAGVADALSSTISRAFNEYADYEQLVGGVDTLFKESSKKVQAYAAQAYKTAGISANSYMEQVTSFSASLLQSIGGDTEAAAEAANTALMDMADNANKMGTAMDSIQNAYQGFAKQNYTMLDNLKLGYGGTKEEMERLLEDASKLANVDYNIDNLDDVYQAIHVIQTEMGITGTTAEEAATTISGSMASAKAAFSNFLTGLANGDADIGELTEELVETVKTAASNIVPALSRIGSTLADNVPKWIADLIAYVAEKAPDMLDAFVDFLDGAVDGFDEAAPGIGESVAELVENIVGWFLEDENLERMVNVGTELAGAIAKGIAQGLGRAVFGKIFDNMYSEAYAAQAESLYAQESGGASLSSIGGGWSVAGGGTYIINGLTYDDGSNISEAAGQLVQALRMARRV